MSIKISEFEPKTITLFDKDQDDDEWECPVPGMEDVWVRLMPPSWGAERDRQQFLNGWDNRPRISLYDVAEFEIALCYAGTNMVVVVPKLDDKGRLTFTEEEPGWEMETIKFDAQGQLSIDEVLNRLRKLPRVIVEAWHEKVFEVAPTWERTFRG